MVGADYDTINFEDGGDSDGKSAWYHKHSWTYEQAQEFRYWMFNYLLEDITARKEVMKFPTRNKKNLMRFVKNFEANYGWKYSNLADIE